MWQSFRAIGRGTSENAWRKKERKTSAVKHKPVRLVTIDAYVGIFNDHFIANSLLTVPVEEFWKSVNIWSNIWHKTRWFTFLDPPYTTICKILSDYKPFAVMALSVLWSRLILTHGIHPPNHIR